MPKTRYSCMFLGLQDFYGLDLTPALSFAEEQLKRELGPRRRP